MTALLFFKGYKSEKMPQIFSKVFDTARLVRQRTCVIK